MTVIGPRRLAPVTGPRDAVSPAPAPLPAAFRRALADLRTARPRPEVRLREIAAPAGQAPHAVALAAEVCGSPGADDVLATGRFVLLHDPSPAARWPGGFRAVTWIRASLEPDVALDQLAGAVAWTWLVEALERRHAEHTQAGGTATRSIAEGFGTLGTAPDATDIELRASWTPAPRDLGAHLEAWSDMIGAFAGLPPEAGDDAPAAPGP